MRLKIYIAISVIVSFTAAQADEQNNVVPRNTIGGAATSDFSLGISGRNGSGAANPPISPPMQHPTIQPPLAPVATEAPPALPYDEADPDSPKSHNEHAKEISAKYLSKLKEDAKHGDAIAQYKLGEIYDSGGYGRYTGITLYRAKAAELWRKSAAQGNIGALKWVESLDWPNWKKDTEAQKWLAKYLAIYKKKAESGDAQAQYDLAQLVVRYDDRDPKALEERIEWIRKSAENGYPPAENELGDFYFGQFRSNRLKGQTSEEQKTISEGLKWYERAAEHGNIGAANTLWLLYSPSVSHLITNGVNMSPNISPDNDKAFKYKKLAAEHGDVDSQLYISSIYTQGNLAPKNINESIKWAMAALKHQDEPELDADHKATGAYIILGNDYHELGNYPEAVKWWTKAAMWGSRPAQYSLSHAYETGEGVEKDSVKAEQWLKAAKAFRVEDGWGKPIPDGHGGFMYVE